MNFTTLAVAFPYVAFVSPFVTQAVKMTFDASLSTNPNHDKIIRGIACLVAGVVGAVALYFLGLQPSSLRDWIVTIVALVAYASGGSVSAMALYSFINSYQHQTPPNPAPATHTTSVSGNTTTVKASVDTGRQPY